MTVAVFLLSIIQNNRYFNYLLKRSEQTKPTAYFYYLHTQRLKKKDFTIFLAFFLQSNYYGLLTIEDLNKIVK